MGRNGDEEGEGRVHNIYSRNGVEGGIPVEKCTWVQKVDETVVRNPIRSYTDVLPRALKVVRVVRCCGCMDV